MTKEEFTKHVEYLRRRLYGHARVNDRGIMHVEIDYVDARIDDLITVYGETKNTSKEKTSTLPE